MYYDFFLDDINYFIAGWPNIYDLSALSAIQSIGQEIINIWSPTDAVTIDSDIALQKKY